ncbi:hypothetical protein EYF80_034666 [Liparis tanakae]|uniref:Uncharacterized protein n=1 Tax=Liparis tanakae TaxID=230148 RepID=A0A4Z2GR09_9TELE|nr:hypothetical protein EYF80_034666 [Liparis tanakae]
MKRSEMRGHRLVLEDSSPLALSPSSSPSSGSSSSSSLPLLFTCTRRRNNPLVSGSPSSSESFMLLFRPSHFLLEVEEWRGDTSPGSGRLPSLWGGGGGGGGGGYGAGSAADLREARHVPAREVLWLVLEDEEKLVLVRRLPPPPPLLTLTRGRLEGMTARDSGGGGGGGTRDWYEYILAEGGLQDFNFKCTTRPEKINKY